MSKVFNYIAGVFLGVLLLLLTVGLPVTYHAVKKMKEQVAQNKSNDTNPYANSTEEKTPCNSLSVSEEYVHEHQHDFTLFPQQISIAYIHAHEAVYKAYHGELHYPPPNLLS
ncbi:MAG: hypothetical protein QM640_15540 [Niabella sp.]